MSLCQFKVQFFAIMAHHKGTASTPACALHLPCDFQRMWTLQWHAPHLFHIVWNLDKNIMSHIKRSHALPPRLPHAVCPLQIAPWWAWLLYRSASANPLVSFGLMKESVASLSIHGICLPLIRAMMYQRFVLGLRLLALATNPASNIRSKTTIWFGLVPPS